MITERDTEHLNKLREIAYEANDILHRAGHHQTADSILYHVGYVVGLAHRLDGFINGLLEEKTRDQVRDTRR